MPGLDMLLLSLAREKEDRSQQLKRAVEKPASGSLEALGCELPEAIPSGARNETLFHYALRLRSAGCPDETVRGLVENANASRCASPLPKEEVDRLVASALGYATGGKGFKHNVFAEMLVACHHAAFLDGTPIVWTGERYETGKDAMESMMLAENPELTRRQRGEVMSYLEHRAPRPDMSHPRYVAFANGVYDIESDELLPNSPDFRIPNVIPHNWNENARCQELDDALDQWSCERGGVRANLEETMGLCMYRGRELHTCPLLVGEGSNGKSSFLNMLVGMLGQENVSSMDIARIGERFQSVALMGKLANIGDDISRDKLSGKTLAVAKKAISGDRLDAEYKCGATFGFRPYCTLVFSCNEVPRMGDNSEGIYRRFVPVAFDGVFSQEAGNRNVRLGEALSSEEAYERAILLGMQGLRRCLNAGGMTMTGDRKAQIKAMRRQNSSVYQFCCDELRLGMPEEVSVLGEPTSTVFDAYRNYCDEAAVRPLSKNAFSDEMCRVYGIGLGRGYCDFGDNRKQARIFVPKG